jgi:hypothetical protein
MRSHCSARCVPPPNDTRSQRYAPRPAKLVQSLSESGDPPAKTCSRARPQESDRRQLWLLPVRRERPDRRPAEKRDELAPSHLVPPQEPQDYAMRFKR